ncbi:MAG: Na+/H+ antiporter subunit E [Planctomycetota bacterium]|jgi:multicomponent Na+:H+ antiporter subunit E
MLLEVFFLALAWVGMTGEPSLKNLLLGGLLGLGVLRATGRRAPWRPSSFRKTPQAVSLTIFFLWQLVVANLRMARAVLGRVDQLHPAIIRVPLDLETDVEIKTLADLITLTPGTLSIDVSTDRKVLFVHVADCPDPEAARREIKDGFERRVKEVYK